MNLSTCATTDILQGLNRAQSDQCDHVLKALQEAISALAAQIEQLNVDEATQLMQVLNNMAGFVLVKFFKLDVEQSNMTFDFIRHAIVEPAGQDALRPNTTLHHLTNPIAQLERTISFQRLTNVVSVAQISILFSSITIVGIYVAGGLIFSKFAHHLRKISERVEAHNEAVEIQTNVELQSRFHRIVHNFINLHVTKRSRRGVSQHESPFQKELDEPCTAASGHRFFIYHPASDWHGAFNATKTSLTDSNVATSLYTDFEELLADVYFYRALNNSKNVVHILLPAVHHYTISEPVHIEPELRPLRICGQKDCYGLPYCRANITGLDISDIEDIEQLHQTPAKKQGRKYPYKLERILVLINIALVLPMFMHGTNLQICYFSILAADAAIKYVMGRTKF